MFDFVTHTWNPLAGACPHECKYCYVGPMKDKPVLKAKYSGEPRIQESEMSTNLGGGNTIFVCNMTDLFAEEVPHSIICQILEKCTSQNKYVFLTKNPGRYHEVSFYMNSKYMTVGATIESDKTYADTKAPSMMERGGLMMAVPHKFQTFISIEPIMDFDLEEFTVWMKNTNPNFVAIGADSGNNHLPEPTPLKIQCLISNLKKLHIRVILKKNLSRIYKEG